VSQYSEKGEDLKTKKEVNHKTGSLGEKKLLVPRGKGGGNNNKTNLEETPGGKNGAPLPARRAAAAAVSPPAPRCPRSPRTAHLPGAAPHRLTYFFCFVLEGRL